MLSDNPPLAEIMLPVHHPNSELKIVAIKPAISSAYAALPPSFSPSSLASSLSSSPTAPRVSEGSILQDPALPRQVRTNYKYMSVITRPGFIAFTVEFSASSRAQTRVIASIAAFVSEYNVYVLAVEASLSHSTEDEMSALKASARAEYACSSSWARVAAEISELSVA
ncbi:unnamed protein product [Penicillium pancosmium]